MAYINGHKDGYNTSLNNGGGFIGIMSIVTVDLSMYYCSEKENYESEDRWKEKEPLSLYKLPFEL